MAGDGLRGVVVGLGVTEVEAGQPVGAVLLTGGDVVQLILHGGGEVVVDERGEVVLQQADHGERHPAGHESVAARHDVATVLDRLDDRRIRRRTTDTQVLHLLHQAGLGVAGRRVGRVTVRGDLGGGEGVTLRQVGQALLGVVGDIATVGQTGGLHVGAEEAGEGDGAAGRGELGLLTGAGGAGDGHLHRGTLRIRHLGGDGALPDELVELELLRVELSVQLTGGGEALAGGADRLVRLLRVLRLTVVAARRVRDEGVTVELLRLLAGGGEALLGQRGRVGTHVGDVAVLVQTLRDTHRAVRGVVQLAAGLLLEGRRHERRVRTAGVGLLLHPGHLHVDTLQRLGESLGLLLTDDHRLTLESAPVIEVTALGDTLTVDGGQLRLEGARVLRIIPVPARVEVGGQVPVLSGDERHALALTLDDDAGGHRLHAARRQSRHDLLPQHRGHLVAVETVEDTAGLLRVDEVLIELTGVFRGGEDGGLGDLVEHHAAHRHRRLEHLEQVPRDGLTLAVGVCREQQLVALLQLRLEVGDLLLLVGADDVERRETVLRVHAESRPRFLLVLRGDVSSTAREVTDVSDRGLDNVVVAQVRLDLLRLGRRLHNDQGLLP